MLVYWLGSRDNGILVRSASMPGATFNHYHLGYPEKNTFKICYCQRSYLVAPHEMVCNADAEKSALFFAVTIADTRQKACHAHDKLTNERVTTHTNETPTHLQHPIRTVYVFENAASTKPLALAPEAKHGACHEGLHRCKRFSHPRHVAAMCTSRCLVHPLSGMSLILWSCVVVTGIGSTIATALCS